MTLQRTFLALLGSALMSAPLCVGALSLTYERPLTLTVSPENPAPKETVRLTIQSYAIDLERSDVTWRANDVVIAKGSGLKEATVTVGKLGERTTVVVTAIDNEGNVARAVATIIPSEVDLLWSADSYVPPFFKGRTLAGTHAKIRAYALVRFATADGRAVPEKDIIYTWSRSGTVLGAVSGRAKSSAILEGPALFGSDVIAVEAETVDHSLRGSARVTIPATDAVLRLYENHPLFGILYHRAIQGDVSTSEREQKVTAVPFFAHIFSPSDASLVYEWQVNDTSVLPNPDEPQTIMIAVNDYQGPAVIALTLTNGADYLMRATGVWRLIFGENSGLFFGNGLFGQ